MHAERSEFDPSEADQQMSPEIKDNVIEFPRKEKPAEHVVEHILKEAGAHDSAIYLNESELALAEQELANFELRYKDAMLALNKNLQNPDVKHLAELSKRVKKLKIDIAFTHEVNLGSDHQELEAAA